MSTWTRHSTNHASNTRVRRSGAQRTSSYAQPDHRQLCSFSDSSSYRSTDFWREQSSIPNLASTPPGASSVTPSAASRLLISEAHRAIIPDKKQTLETMSRIDPESYTREEVEKLVKDRRFMLAYGYMTTGESPNSSFAAHQQDILRERREASSNSSTMGASRTSNDDSNVTELAIRSNAEELEACEHHGPCCNAKIGAVLFAKTVKMGTERELWIPLREDTGSEANWISPQVAKNCNLRFYVVQDPMTFQDFSGQEFTPKYKVDMTLKGKARKTKRVVLFITPDHFPFEGVLLGRSHVEKEGHPNHTFYEAPDNGALVMVPKKATADEKSEMENRRTENERQAAKIANQRSVFRKKQGSITLPASSPSADSTGRSQSQSDSHGSEAQTN